MPNLPNLPLNLQKQNLNPLLKLEKNINIPPINLLLRIIFKLTGLQEEELYTKVSFARSEYAISNITGLEKYFEESFNNLDEKFSKVDVVKNYRQLNIEILRLFRNAKIFDFEMTQKDYKILQSIALTYGEHFNYEQICDEESIQHLTFDIDPREYIKDLKKRWHSFVN